MALKILQDIAKDINNSIFYTIMADEVTDASNHEQFVICLRWVDQFLEVHEDFIGPATRSRSNVVTRLSLRPSDVAGTCQMKHPTTSRWNVAKTSQ